MLVSLLLSFSGELSRFELPPEQVRIGTEKHHALTQT